MARFYRHVVETYELDQHHERLLESAARQWDRAAAARRQIESEGATFVDRFGQPREHPACNVERGALALFARLVRECGLDATDNDTRPPSLRY